MTREPSDVQRWARGRPVAVLAMTAFAALTCVTGCGGHGRRASTIRGRITADVDSIEAGLGTGRFAVYIGDRQMLQRVRRLLTDLRGVPPRSKQAILGYIENELDDFDLCGVCITAIEKARS